MDEDVDAVLPPPVPVLHAVDVWVFFLSYQVQGAYAEEPEVESGVVGRLLGDSHERGVDGLGEREVQAQAVVVVDDLQELLVTGESVPRVLRVLPDPPVAVFEVLGKNLGLEHEVKLVVNLLRGLLLPLHDSFWGTGWELAGLS